MGIGVARPRYCLLIIVWQTKMQARQTNDLQSHLCSYAYTYQPKFKFLNSNLELILGGFFIVVYISAFVFKSLRTRI